MRLTYLRATDWMAYPTIDIDFNESEYVITGQNNHGKSAILDAITWALWGRIGRKVDQRSADKLVRAGADIAKVEVNFLTSDGQSVVVTRERPVGKTGTLNVYVDGVRQTYHTIAESQEAIDRLIGLDYDSITSGPFMVQRQSDAFMAADPRARKDILIRLLGLDQYEVLHKVASAERVSAEREESEAERRLGEIAEATANLVAEEAAAARAAQLLEQAKTVAAEKAEVVIRIRERVAAADAAKAVLEAAKARASRADVALVEQDRLIEGAQQALADQQEALQRPEPVAPEHEDPVQLRESLAAAEERVARGAVAADAMVGLTTKRDRWSERMTEANRRRSILPTIPCHGEGEYATCQFLTEIVPVEEIQKAAEAIARWDEEIVTLADHVRVRDERDLPERDRLKARIVEVERADSIYQTTLDAYISSRAPARALLDHLEAMVTQRQAERVVRVAEVEAAYAEVRHHSQADTMTEVDDSIAYRESENADRALEAAGRLVREVEAAVAVSRAAAAHEGEWQAKAKGARERAATYRLLESAWHRDGVPSAIIERSIPLIESRANDVLARFPQSLTLALRTQKPVNKGAGMAETLDIIVTIYGWEREYGMLSVGARLRVDLALRVALGELLAHRSGRSVRTLWLDEPLADLDAEGREAVIETLNVLRQDFDLIVAISHHPDFNDRFGSRINVTQDDEGISTAEVMA